MAFGLSGDERGCGSYCSNAKVQPIPEDNLVLPGIKQMAAGMYFRELYEWRRARWIPSYLAANADFSNEYERAREQAADILNNVSAGGEAIDVSNMVEEKTSEGYRSRPWEDDAFYCGEVAGEYWLRGEAPADRSGNQCSRQYAFAYHARKRGDSSIHSGTVRDGS